jgi:hypothetical protein
VRRHKEELRQVNVKLKSSDEASVTMAISVARATGSKALTAFNRDADKAAGVATAQLKLLAEMLGSI